VFSFFQDARAVIFCSLTSLLGLPCNQGKTNGKKQQLVELLFIWKTFKIEQKTKNCLVLVQGHISLNNNIFFNEWRFENKLRDIQKWPYL